MIEFILRSEIKAGSILLVRGGFKSKFPKDL